ncbi:MAG: DUF732 domain-containing protein [Acidimicrobiales bacterium]
MVPRCAVVGLAGLAALLLASCGGRAGAASAHADEKFLNSVYSQAPDIGTYRSSPQLFRLGQTVCDDLRAGASVRQLGDRLPLAEGSVLLPPGDLGVVISSAVDVLCPQYHKLLGS